MYNAAMAVELQTVEPWGPPQQLGPYRESDFAQLPDKPRCELLYGSLLVTPSPLVRHQLVLGRLHALFLSHAETHEGLTILAPMDVRLADHSIVQPDLIYVTPARREVIRERIFGAPDLLVEILSPSTARRDRGAKMKLYADSGVAEYWLVDPESETFEFLENRDGAFVVRLPEDGIYASRAVAELTLDLEAFWRGLPA
jgi:Uma2 family endonuclease